jgi:hypothetical protein
MEHGERSAPKTAVNPSIRNFIQFLDYFRIYEIGDVSAKRRLPLVTMSYKWESLIIRNSTKVSGAGLPHIVVVTNKTRGKLRR